MKKNNNYITKLDMGIERLFRAALSISLTSFPRAVFFAKAIAHQARAKSLRGTWSAQNLHVPPFMIFSVTQRCNLSCSGCYHRAFERDPGDEITLEKIESVLAEARELGISAVLLAGGEPLAKNGLLDAAGKFPDIIFPLFTNGMLLDEAAIDVLKRNKNIIPIISVEGLEKDTDERRGNGVFLKIETLMASLKKAEIFFGLSITVSSANFDLVTDPAFVEKMNRCGARLFFYVEYTPVSPGSENLVLSATRRAMLLESIKVFRKKTKSLFIAFPGEESLFGGCLSAGRGFIHVSAKGNVEPCPFAPYSDADLNTVSLKEALQSPFLKAIRENHAELSETGGCALWNKRAWVQSLLEKA